MAGETVKTAAICLAVYPWSRTSHVVSWLTDIGKVVTIVKGAQRPKSAFLGQYDLNYTCQIIYYARAKGDVHALRECSPVAFREELRSDTGSLALASYFRFLSDSLAPQGPDAAAWFEALQTHLDALAEKKIHPFSLLLKYEICVLELLGLWSGISPEGGTFVLRGERKISVSSEVARCLGAPEKEKNIEVLLDAARVIGVFYTFHVDVSAEVRRSALQIATRTIQKKRSIK